MHAIDRGSVDCVCLLLDLCGITDETIPETDAVSDEIKDLLDKYRKKTVNSPHQICLLQQSDLVSLVTGKRTTRVAVESSESNSKQSRRSINAIRSAGNRWYLFGIFTTRITSVCVALDRRLVTKLRSLVAFKENSID